MIPKFDVPRTYPRERSLPLIAFAVSISLILAACGGSLTESQEKHEAGVELYQAGDIAEAIDAYDDAISLDPEFATAFVNRGAAYNALGEFERAIEDLNEAVRLNPRLPAAYNNRGYSYDSIDREPRAILDFNEAIRLAPNEPDAYANRALAQTELGDDEKAEADIERAVELGVNRSVIESAIARIKRQR